MADIDLGIEPVDEDLGIEPVTEDIGIEPINELELQRFDNQQKKEQQKQMSATIQAAAQAAKEDPKNWTIQETKDRIKENPPQSIEEEAKAKMLVDSKKDEQKKIIEEIRQAQPHSFKQVVSDFIHTFWTGENEQTRGVKADRAYVLSKMFDVPLSVINKNYESFAKAANFQGDEGQMGAKKILSAVIVPPIAAGMVANPLATGLTLAGFQTLAEGENALISRLKGEKYQFMRGLTAKDLAPEEAAPVTKDLIDMAEFVAQIGIGVGLYHGASKIAPPGTTLSQVPKNTVELMTRFGKDLIVNYKLPKTMYLPTATGEDVQVPTENVFRMAMDPKIWESVKTELSVAKTPKEVVDAKKQAFTEALERKQLEIEEVGAKEPIVPARPPETQIKGIAEEGLRLAEAEFTKVNVGRELTLREQQAQDFVRNDFPAARQAYIDRSVKEFGSDNVISADIGKFAVGQKSAVESADTHEAGSALAKARAAELLKDPARAGKPVGFTAGGSGSGKSFFLRDLAQKQGRTLEEHFALVYDTNMNSYPSAKAKIDAALDSGHPVTIMYVYRDPLQAWQEGVLPRVRRQDRIVPIKEHISTHEGALPTVRRIAQEYKDNPNVEILAIDNSFGKGLARPVTLDEIQSYEYTSIGPKLYAQAKEAHKNGQITAAELQTAVKGHKGSEELHAQDFPGSDVPGGIPPTGGQGPTAPGRSDLPNQGLKERKFAQTLRESETSSPEVKAAFPEGKYQYQPISNEQTLSEARNLIATDREAVLSAIEGKARPTRVSNAAGQLLIEEAQAQGRFSDAIRIAERLVTKNTEMGQAIQALAIWGKLSPEGVLRFTQKQLEPHGIKLDPKVGEEFVKRAGDIEKLPPGREQDMERAKLMRDIVNQVPANALRKISMLQTLAQLLNPKTMIRNFLGNAGLVGLENTSQTMAAGLDAITGAFTGKRTTTLPSLKTQAQGALKGAKEGFREAIEGVDLVHGQTDKYNLPRSGIFNKGVMGAFERALRVSLGGVDRMFYQAAFNDSLRGQMKLSKVAEPTAEMIETAHAEGLRRTLQDDNALTAVFQGLKRSLNAGKEFGLGDMVIKYTQVPANLINRGIEYSPFEFYQTVWQMAKPLFGKPFDQQKFVRSTSTALTGTGLLVGTGLILGHLGIITGRREKDRDIAASQELAGLRSYQINVDALKRFALSGMDPEQAKRQEGDTLVSYDWFQPASIDLAMGANIALAKDQSVVGRVSNFLSSLPDRFFSATETLAEQPLLQGVKKLTGKETISEGLTEITKGMPASFVPTLLNQIKQLSDNTARNTRGVNLFEEATNQAKSKIPGLSDDLPPQITVLGRPREMYQLGSNNPFNVFLNPAFVNTYKPDATTAMVLDMWERSGQTVQFPRVAQKSVRVNGEQLQLAPDLYTRYQSYIGRKTDILFNKLSQNDKFMSAPDELKAKLLQRVLTNINNGARIEILGDRPKHKPDANTLAIMKAVKVDLDEMDQKDLGIEEAP